MSFAWMRADQRRADAQGRRRSVSSAAVHSLLVLPAMAILLGGCAGGQSPEQRGARLIVHYGCGACHMIPGIHGADGLRGPPLTHWSQRSHIASVLANNPDTLALWISDPQGIAPGVDMPDMGIKQQEARDIAAYLDSIH